MTDPLPATWEWHVASDYEAGSAIAAERLLSAWRTNPKLLLCAATGNSPARTYELFAQGILSNGKSPTNLRILKLDEWGGLPADDPATCETYLLMHLVKPLGVVPERFIGFQSESLSPSEECHRVAGWLNRNGPVDVCVLGIGINGHLGFNEPADVLNAECHVAKLTSESLSHAMLSATSKRPSYGLTVGMREISIAQDSSASVRRSKGCTAETASYGRSIDELSRILSHASPTGRMCLRRSRCRTIAVRIRDEARRFQMTESRGEWRI